MYQTMWRDAVEDEPVVERPRWLVTISCSGGNRYQWATGEEHAMGFRASEGASWVIPVRELKFALKCRWLAVIRVDVERY